ncbi:hypothetical protein QUA81_31320 [Microcoleus sp. F6_B4]
METVYVVQHVHIINNDETRSHHKQCKADERAIMYSQSSAYCSSSY